jgi:uncharacterized membrane protein
MPPTRTDSTAGSGPPSSASTWRIGGWWIAFGGTLAIALLAMSPPVLPPGARDIVMAMFSGVCHQLPGRSPHVAGVQLAVCHRCAGIYWAMPAASLLWAALRGIRRTPLRGAPWLLVASVAPAGIDWGLDVIGLWDNTPLSRMLTGAAFGLAAGYFLTLALVSGRTASDRTADGG